ncbi:electron transfer complex ferredoxin TmcB [Desulfomicrobium baculatum]|uniref:4Fe-4S ferredoxin iron-sulfur binding domain protein n=1 Tax=Desulfomicrobium baculatum (strain DSM 4028 / VKM B-1378 / X) TaxID=525897 RepID=C7LX17_DESBD|nr:(Fe-S)-binding protein [Desulfomicrobium baculatum]ACU88690.1 4Fe-4S ferredoxin iron-sulfur binding domain protein [Desulfomicrobium baculatum DSM 4028]
MKERVWIKDEGVERGAEKLTPERIEKTINAVFDNEAGARLKAYVDTCAHCGLCSEACHFFLSRDRDPRFSPVGKVKQTVWEMLDKKGKVSVEFMKHATQVAQTECNLCRRCVQYCPFGIDIGYMMSMVRRIVHKLELTPLYIQDTAHSHSATMNQMWVKDDEWIDALIWQEDELREELPNARIPLEKEGAEIMYSVIGPEPKFRTQLIYQAAAIMNEAGCDWTMPATPGWDNSDMAMFTGDTEMMGRLKRIHFETAARLRVKKIVMGECGHAFRSVYDTGNRVLGWQMPPVQVVHALEFYWDLLNEGKIKVAKQIEEPVTFHDPCNVVRGRGLHEKAREVVRAFCPNLVEMHPNREHNICCAAGGGVINCGPPFKNSRVESNSVKAEQLKATGVRLCIAPCHNCHGGLEDIIHKYKLDMELKFLGEIIYDCMEKPNAV